ncbi:hypothetical protein EVAR_100145_1 [Eumeta japonica]|uniref:Uncharacterized protein n=1 Tax=Eumeta variegata TaxID=151549 RepID=A0A4C1ZT63_EUMVA|nr:hypothetical protein EVAR_100145_1 [Eumeta japonica]
MLRGTCSGCGRAAGATAVVCWFAIEMSQVRTAACMSISIGFSQVFTCVFRLPTEFFIRIVNQKSGSRSIVYCRYYILLVFRACFDRVDIECVLSSFIFIGIVFDTNFFAACNYDLDSVPRFEPDDAFDCNSCPTYSSDPELALKFDPGPGSRFCSPSRFQFQHRSRFQFLRSQNKTQYENKI